MTESLKPDLGYGWCPQCLEPIKENHMEGILCYNCSEELKLTEKKLDNESKFIFGLTSHDWKEQFDAEQLNRLLKTINGPASIMSVVSGSDQYEYAVFNRIDGRYPDAALKTLIQYLRDEFNEAIFGENEELAPFFDDEYVLKIPMSLVDELVKRLGDSGYGESE